MKATEIKNIVREGYGKIAQSSCSCGCKKREPEKIAKMIGYSDEELKTPGNLGLGCGNPVALGSIKEKDIVVDLGSGAGFDSFLAAKRAVKGKVIGIDMTPEMIEKARENAEKYGYKNVEFKLGDIEDIPLKDNSANIVISNCVINLAPDKSKVFRETFRILKKGGKMFVSDIVLLGELTEKQKNNKELLTGCVAGALQKEKYIEIAEDAGFSVRVIGEDKEISKKQYSGINLESLKMELRK